MARLDHEVSIAAGGLAGSTLASVLAERGARLVVVERGAWFRDRMRGDGRPPRGDAEARALGIYDLLRRADACEMREWIRRGGCCLVLADELQNDTVPDIRLLPMGCVPGLGNGGELAIGDMRCQQPHQRRR